MGLFRQRGKREQTPPCAVVVVAAGSSTRMGQDKMMLELAGKPVVLHALQAFQDVPEVSEIIVVTRGELVAEIPRLCREYGLDKVKTVIRGGASRTQSARLGTLEVSRDAELIAIHDGARPFVTVPVIREAIQAAARTGAAAPAIPVKDTIKVAQNGVVTQTLDRATLFAVQTPQVFEASLIRAALQKALEDDAELTDDCAAVERLGMGVTLTQGDERNLKLTTPADLIWGEALLEGAQDL